MTIGVGSSAQSGVAGASLGVGVVVVAVFKICTVVEKKAEPTAFEIGAVAVEIVGAKLIDHQDDDQPGMCVVGAGKAPVVSTEQPGKRRATGRHYA